MSSVYIKLVLLQNCVKGLHPVQTSSPSLESLTDPVNYATIFARLKGSGKTWSLAPNFFNVN